MNAFGALRRRTTKYGAYSSKAERLIVDQKVAGSSPARRPCDRLSLSIVAEQPGDSSGAIPAHLGTWWIGRAGLLFFGRRVVRQRL